MPAIKKPNQHFDATLYTGNGGTQSITNSGFQPDFVWVKSRQYTTVGHSLFDALRPIGVNSSLPRLVSNSTDAETNNGGLTAFVSNGFSLNNDAYINSTSAGGNMVAWQWNAGGTTVTNTSGTISAQVRANPTAGFSIVTYTGTGANATVGHGLGVTPGMVIVKARSTTGDWCVTMPTLGSNNVVFLNLTNAAASFPTVFNGLPTSTIFNIGTAGSTNTNAATYVAYCFAAVAGYSAFGSYTGNGSTDGTFLHLGFRPKFVMIKSTGSQDWVMLDSSTNPYNVAGNYLRPNSSGAENGGSTPTTSTYEDFLSNGIKFRNDASSSGYTNGSGVTYIYMAFAEAPFKFSNGR